MERLRSLLARSWPWVAVPAVILWTVWPLASHSWDHVIDTRAMNPTMWQTLEPDIWLQIWIVAWASHALVTNPLALYQGNAFHPTPDVIARSDTLLGLVPLFAPAWFLTGNPVFAFQFAMVASYVLCGITLYALLNYLGCTRVIAAGIAVLWSLMWFRVYDGLPRAHLLQYQYLPLIVLFFDRYLGGGRLRDLVLAGIFLTWQSLTTYWHAYFAMYVGAVTVPVSAAFVRSAGSARRFAWALFAVAASATVLVLLSLPYLAMAGHGELVPKSLPAALHWYFGSPSFPRSISLAAIAGILFVALRGKSGTDLDFLENRDLSPISSRMRRIGVTFVLIAAAGILLSLPASDPSMRALDRMLAAPRDLAAWVVPGFRYLRDEYRFLALASLGIYGLAAIGVDGAYRVLRSRGPATAAGALVAYFAVLGAPLTQLHFPLTPAIATTQPPPVYEWLRDNGDGGALLELPISKNLSMAWRETQCMFFSTWHWLPLLNGYTGHSPREHYNRIRELAARLPDPSAIEELRTSTGLRWIVLHADAQQDFASWQQAPRVKQIGTFGDDILVEVLP